MAINFKLETKANRILSKIQKTPGLADKVYRKLWFLYVVEDVKSYMRENYPRYVDDLVQMISEDVATRYVYNCRYDCNLSYWDNINNLIGEVAQNYN
ncbi:MAG: hypothetical protein J5525_12080 [Lachnospiraceae bacterium]|nr:hypothetical protein [Lachnospiraceae bacterium]